MSSATQSTRPIPSTDTSTATTTATTTPEPPTSNKKKFGKNLSKLTAPPSAPPAAAAAGRKPNSSSKNGLLLLSTKRLSSGSNTGVAPGAGGAGGAGGGGILSSKSSQILPARPLPTLALHTEYNPSTHDALMGVVVGASRLDSQQHPDAWGVAEKQQASAPVESVDLGSSPPPGEDCDSHPKPASEPVESPDAAPRDKDLVHDEAAKGEEHNIESSPAEFRTSNWDEYGGRGVTNGGGSAINEDQGAYMAKLARERAEKRRGEEDIRIQQQNERAAEKLRELEKKIASKKNAERGDAQNARKTEISAILGLEKLGRPQSSGDQPRESAPFSGRGGQQRTLYDPNAPSKSYSSLLGGKQEASIPSTKEVDSSVRLHAFAPVDRGPSQDIAHSAADPQQSDRPPLIQLASYDDRDRGDRGTSSGPRMLFDPKSGSMVAVPSREENTTCARSRKERGKKVKPTRDIDSKKEISADTTPDSKGGRKGKSRKDDGNAQVRGKGGGMEASAVGKSDPRKGKMISPRKFPRTNGVLYSRDRKGNLSCADGCDGDLGYGVHSVPGGRMKNSDAYAKYVYVQKETKEDSNATYDDTSFSNSVETTNMKPEHILALQTGFHIAATKEPKHDWIKPHDKIELITGVEESPTLQATAREWAPTQSNFGVPGREKLAKSFGRRSEEIDNNNMDQDDDANGDDAPVSMSFEAAVSFFWDPGDLHKTHHIVNSAGPWFRSSTKYGLCHAVTFNGSNAGVEQCRFGFSFFGTRTEWSAKNISYLCI
jgi:hypothetical protein